MIQVWVKQERDAAGEPQVAEFLQPIVQANPVQTWPDAVMWFLRPLHPVRTPMKSVYKYRDPAQGSGELRVEGLNLFQLDRLNELVHMEEICRTIGMWDPNPQEDIPFYLVPFVVKIRNPYVQIGVGVSLYLTGGVAMMLVPVLVPEVDPFSRVGIPVLGLFLTILSLLLIRRGFKRLRWWRRARAQAKRDGGPIPEELQAWI